MEEELLRSWDSVEEDNPIPLLTRRKITGEQAMVAYVKLAKGCHVQRHAHPSEQISCVLSGRMRWTVGFEGESYAVETTAGQVLRLPANFPHEVHALEDSEAFDVLAPPGPMGVDSQGKA